MKSLQIDIDISSTHKAGKTDKACKADKAHAHERARTHTHNAYICNDDCVSIIACLVQRYNVIFHESAALFLCCCCGVSVSHQASVEFDASAAMAFVDARPWSVFPSFLVEMHGKGGNFCIFLLKIAEKEGKTDLAALMYYIVR